MYRPVLTGASLLAMGIDRGASPAFDWRHRTKELLVFGMLSACKAANHRNDLASF